MDGQTERADGRNEHGWEAGVGHHGPLKHLRNTASARKKRPGRPASRVAIREMELGDLAGVFALGEHEFTLADAPNLYRTWDEDELLELFAGDGDLCLVAESREGDLLGFVLGSIVEKRRTGWIYGYVVWLCIAPEAQGRGIGKRLVDKLTRIFIDEGARMMMADTDAGNEEAVGFFERMGFTQLQRHVYMTRNLTKHPLYRKRRERETKGGSHS
jgi:ribosomal protein S18 acetylase RimI-like enzyme